MEEPRQRAGLVRLGAAIAGLRVRRGRTPALGQREAGDGEDDEGKGSKGHAVLREGAGRPRQTPRTQLSPAEIVAPAHPGAETRYRRSSGRPLASAPGPPPRRHGPDGPGAGAGASRDQAGRSDAAGGPERRRPAAPRNGGTPRGALLQGGRPRRGAGGNPGRGGAGAARGAGNCRHHDALRRAGGGPAGVPGAKADGGLAVRADSGLGAEADQGRPGGVPEGLGCALRATDLRRQLREAPGRCSSPRTSATSARSTRRRPPSTSGSTSMGRPETRSGRPTTERW